MAELAPAVDDDAADEAALVDAARAGDRAALERLIARHQARIYRFGLKMCRDPEAAKDVVQETLIAMARGVRDFRGGASLSTWLYTIARSYCIKARRKSKFAPRELGSLDAAPDAVRVPDPGPRSDEQLGARRVEQVLERAIGELDDAHREVLVLRDVEGLTAPEVAAVLGIVGAGGIGYYLSDLSRNNHWDMVAFILIVFLVLVYAIDFVSKRLRGLITGERA